MRPVQYSRLSLAHPEMSLRTLGGSILIGPSGPIDCDNPCCTGGSGPPGPCNYVLDCSDIDVDTAPRAGGIYSRSLNVEDACPWHVETTFPWIHPEPPTSHLSAGNVRFSVDANPDLMFSRSGFISVIKTSSGPGSLLCNITVNQGPGASCSALITPTIITASGGPVTVDFNGNAVPVSLINPWSGQLNNIGSPCSWTNTLGGNSWLGYFMLAGQGAVGFNAGPDGPTRPHGWWFALQTSGGGPNLWKKVYGSTPFGVYGACDEFGVFNPLVDPQIIIIS